MSAALPAWNDRLNALMPLYGHRNWIVVADAAYPAQSNPNIETIAADAEQIDAVRTVRDAIAGSRHVRANIYVDAELNFVAEADAPGIGDYRKELDGVLYGATVNRMQHEQIIAKLDQSAQLYRILIVKTDMTIPYTSVFFELGCGYWSAEAEGRLREAMLAAKTKCARARNGPCEVFSRRLKQTAEKDGMTSEFPDKHPAAAKAS